MPKLTPEDEQAQINKLVAARDNLRSIREYTDRVRAAVKFTDPLMDLCIAVEQLWNIEKRRVNRELAKKGLKQIKR